jgi:hypothetical protein
MPIFRPFKLPPCSLPPGAVQRTAVVCLPRCSAAQTLAAQTSTAGQALSTDEPDRTSNPAGRRRTAASQGADVFLFGIVKKYGDDNGGGACFQPCILRLRLLVPAAAGPGDPPRPGCVGRPRVTPAGPERGSQVPLECHRPGSRPAGADLGSVRARASRPVHDGGGVEPAGGPIGPATCRATAAPC